MTGIGPLNFSYAPEAKTDTPKKSKFVQVSKDAYINPDQVAMIIHGKKPNSTYLMADERNKIVTLTNAIPEEIVKVFDRYA